MFVSVLENHKYTLIFRLVAFMLLLGPSDLYLTAIAFVNGLWHWFACSAFYTSVQKECGGTEVPEVHRKF